MSTGLVEQGTPSAVEEGGLTTRTETSHELSIANAQAQARYEMEGAIVMARKFPRNEDEVFGKLMKACARTGFADDCCYSFPRGGEKIEGPSVYLAKEAARCWGNIRWGFDVVRDDEHSRQIRGWAWDVETNSKSSYEAAFKKLVYRKKGGWIKPDERDLRELTNRQGAILVRNCLLDLIPSDLIADAVRESKKTLEKGATSDPEGTRKNVIKAFSSLGIKVEEIEEYLGHALAQATASEIAELRTIYKSISDGNSRWAEYLQAEEKPTPTGAVSAADLTKQGAAGSAPVSTPVSTAASTPESTASPPAGDAPKPAAKGQKTLTPREPGQDG